MYMRFFLPRMLALMCMIVLPAQAYSQTPSPERITLSVPISTNNVERPSALYLNVFVKQPRQPISAFIKQSQDASDKVFGELLDSIATDDFSKYKAISLGTDKDKKYMFDAYAPIKKAFDKSVVLYKVYLGSDILYIIKTFYFGRDRTLNLLFSIQDDNYYFDSRNKLFPIKEVIGTAISDDEVRTPELNYVLQYVGQPYSKKIVQGKYPVEIGFSNRWVVNDTVRNLRNNKTLKADPIISNIGLFYNDVQQLIENADLNSVFTKMEPKSIERFTGNSTDYDVTELSAYVLNMAVPDTISMIIDADPFYVVYGTNLTLEYQSIMEMVGVDAQKKALKRIGLSHRYLLKQKDGTLKLTHLRSSRFVDRLLQDNRFLDNVVIPELIKSFKK